MYVSKLLLFKRRVVALVCVKVIDKHDEHSLFILIIIKGVYYYYYYYHKFSLLIT